MERAYPDLANNMFLFTNDYYLAVLENYSFHVKPCTKDSTGRESIKVRKLPNTMNSGKCKMSWVTRLFILLFPKTR